MDRLDAMQVLLTVVDQGSLSAGSRKLNAPLPTVSRKMAELERHLGTQLLIRTSRQIQLTDAGRDYADAARAIVAQLKDAEQRASGEYERPRGELTVTAMVGFSRLILLPLASEFLQEHPEISLNVVADDRVVQLVDEGVDVAVRIGALPDSSLFALNVGHVEMVTAASPAYLERMGWPSHPHDLVQHDAVSLVTLREQWTYSCAGDSIEATPNVRLRANSAFLAVTAAVDGVGICRLPKYQVADELRSGSLVQILDENDAVKTPVHLVYVRQGLLPIKVRAFIDWMTPRLRQRLNDLQSPSDSPLACVDDHRVDFGQLRATG